MHTAPRESRKLDLSLLQRGTASLRNDPVRRVTMPHAGTLVAGQGRKQFFIVMLINPTLSSSCLEITFVYPCRKIGKMKSER